MSASATQGGHKKKLICWIETVRHASAVSVGIMSSAAHLQAYAKIASGLQ